ncbi:FprA family A-type flavoprotein [Brachyspira intermedia]|uniref:FprA family A-type flavoprotein n=1 Tax=Brachyspira intermedia TaxID=84377 RepID=UPI003005CAD8
MHCVRKVTEDLYWVGANEHRLALFENVHPLTKGVSYNSYVLLDEKTVLFDTVDWAVCRQFLDNLEYVLNGKKLDYMVINHMEPDHAASIDEVLIRHPETKVIATEKAFMFMDQFGFTIPEDKKEQVKEGDSKKFGKHEVAFVAAQMVHWPEAMVTFDTTNGVLFSADAFGSFIALDGRLFNDEVNFDRDWLDEARRYYTNIVGKYGPHVQNLLKKAGGIIDKIKMFCPLHGPVWRNNLGYILDKYNKWSTYEPEEKGVLIVYASMYGNTENMVGVLAAKLAEKGVTNIAMHDVSSTHVSYLISDTFKLSHVVLASVTYNLNIYPPMHDYLNDMKALNVQKRKFAIIENGSWAPKSGTLMQEFIENNLKQCEVLDAQVSVSSSMKAANVGEMDALVDAIVESINK